MESDKCQCLDCRYSREDISLEKYLEKLNQLMENYLIELDKNGSDISFRTDNCFSTLEVIQSSLDYYIPMVLENSIKQLYLISRKLFFKTAERRLIKRERLNELIPSLYKFEVGKISCNYHKLEENKLDKIPLKRFWDGLFQRLETPRNSINYKALEIDILSYFSENFEKFEFEGFITLLDTDLDIPVRLTKENNKFYMEYMR